MQTIMGLTAMFVLALTIGTADGLNMSDRGETQTGQASSGPDDIQAPYQQQHQDIQAPYQNDDVQAPAQSDDVQAPVRDV